MKAYLHHVALNVTAFDWYVNFFQQQFDMEIRRRAGEAPNRKVWFFEGIQLNECCETAVPANIYDHISIAVPDVGTAREAAIKAGCIPLPGGDNWFACPNGVRVELMRAD